MLNRAEHLTERVVAHLVERDPIAARVHEQQFRSGVWGPQRVCATGCASRSPDHLRSWRRALGEDLGVAGSRSGADTVSGSLVEAVNDHSGGPLPEAGPRRTPALPARR